MVDKIMRAEAQISAKDAGFSSTLKKMGGQLRGFASAAKSVQNIPALGLSPKDAAKMARLTSGLSGLSGAMSSFSGPMVGVAAVAGIAVAAKKLTDAGAKLQHERVRMEAAGMSQNEIADATMEAAKLSAKVPNLGQTEIAHMLRNARTIVGSYQEAAEIIEPMAKMRSMVEAAHPGVNLAEDFDKVIKGLEIKGVTQNPEEFRRYMEGMSKALNVFGDTLKPSDYYEMFKLGRQSTRGLSHEYMTKIAPTLAQEMGGPQAGTQQQAFFSAIVGGHMTKTAMKQMIDYGLVDPKMVHTPKGGHLAQVKPGGIVGSRLAMLDPYRWVNEIMLPALAKKGVVDPDKIQEVIATLFSKGTAAQFVGILATQQARIEKDAAQARGAKDYNAADLFNAKDFTVAVKSVETQLGNLAETIGRPFAQDLAPKVNEFAKALGELNEYLAKQNKKAEEGKPTDLENWWDRVKHNVRYGPERKGGLSWDQQDISHNERDIASLKKEIGDLGTQAKGTNRQASWARRRIADLQAQVDALEKENTRIKAKNVPMSPFMMSYEQMTPGQGGPKGFAAFPLSAGYDRSDLPQYQGPRKKGQVPWGSAPPDWNAGSGAYAGYGASGAPPVFGTPQHQQQKPFDLSALLSGKITAVVDKPVDVTGKVQLEGSAQVNVKVAVDGPGKVTGLSASSKGNIKVNPGATMPDAGKAN